MLNTSRIHRNWVMILCLSNFLLGLTTCLLGQRALWLASIPAVVFALTLAGLALIEDVPVLRNLIGRKTILIFFAHSCLDRLPSEVLAHNKSLRGVPGYLVVADHDDESFRPGLKRIVLSSFHPDRSNHYVVICVAEDSNCLHETIRRILDTGMTPELHNPTLSLR